MNAVQLDHNICTLLKQRNYLLGVSLLSLVMNGLLVLGILSVLGRYYLYEDSKERLVHIIPGSLNDSMTLSKYDASDSYFVHMARVVLDLRLNNTPKSALDKHATLLSYVSPNAHTLFRKSLEEDAESYKKLDLSTIFVPSAISVDRDANVIHVDGHMDAFYGGNRRETMKKHYHIHYSYVNGVFQVEDFIKEEEGE